jgi:hypothetical protein
MFWDTINKGKRHMGRLSLTTKLNINIIEINFWNTIWQGRHNLLLNKMCQCRISVTQQSNFWLSYNSLPTNKKCKSHITFWSRLLFNSNHILCFTNYQCYIYILNYLSSSTCSMPNQSLLSIHFRLWKLKNSFICMFNNMRI